MTLLLALLVAATALFLSGFFSGSETGLYCVNRLRVYLGAERRDPADVRLSRLLEDQQGTLSVTLIGTNLMNYLITAAVTYIFSVHLGLEEGNTELYTVLLLTPVVFVFGEVTPKNIFQLHADRLMRAGSGLLTAADHVFRFTGAVRGLRLLTRFFSRLVGADLDRRAEQDPRTRVGLMLRDALVGDPVGDEQSEIIDRIIQLGETPLHAVMVPRNDVVALDANTARPALEAKARRNPHARMPVYHRSHRYIIGIVKVDELLSDPDWQVVGERLRPVLTLSAHDTVAEAIISMQKQRHPMAILVDRTGRLLGIVTMKDLLEEVVGELEAW